MIKTISRMMLVAAATTLAVAPIAAQAGTRASDSNSVYSVSSPGMGRAADGEKAAAGSTIILAILAAVAVGAGIFFAIDSDDEGQSPGT
jgi:hypothetical protein